MRVNYDPRKWFLLANTMSTVYLRKILDPITRATLFDDAFWFARTERLDYTIALSLLQGYQYEDSTPVLESARRALRHLEAILRNTATEEEFSVSDDFDLIEVGNYDRTKTFSLLGVPC